MTVQQTRESAALVALKAAHTLIWFTVEASTMYVLYKGLRGQPDRRAAIGGAISPPSSPTSS